MAGSRSSRSFTPSHWLPAVLRVFAGLAIAAIAIALRGGPPAAAESGQITSYMPVGEGLAIVSWTGGSVAELTAALSARRCGAGSLWLLDPGAEPVSFILGAPPHVNRAWIERVGSDVAPAGQPLLVSCARAAARSASPFSQAQVLSVYGYPGIPAMGLLGAMTPEAAADEAARFAAQYDALNGDRRVIPALQPIAVVAQGDPGAEGNYLFRMPGELLEAYVNIARERGFLVILDVQPGWADPLSEVRRFEDLLSEPFVHLAIDPEYMTRPDGLAPGIAIGTITAREVNEVQAYLAELVRTHGLPPKVLVVHQFLDSMIEVPAAGFADHPEVEILIDMDGWGPPFGKLSKYQRFSLGSYAERAGLKLFLLWDVPLLTPADVQALDPPPDLVIYQ